MSTNKRYTFSWVAASPDIKSVTTGRVCVIAHDYSVAEELAKSKVRANYIDWMLEATDNIEIIPSLEREEEL